MFDAVLAGPTASLLEGVVPRQKAIVVGFAGGGGACFGLRQAFGRDPDVALNHWPTAIFAHQRHFPQTLHILSDIYEVDPRTVLPGVPIGLAWFSPDCTDHSKAKGRAPKSERIRGLAWSIIPWALHRRPDVIEMENVEEWFDWGPVYRCPADFRAKGVAGEPGEPIKALRGVTRERFTRTLGRLGYDVEIHYGRAADYGDPTTRHRLVLIARADSKPIRWPAPTHAPRAVAAERELKPWRGACEVIDFSLPCPSIFLSQEEAKALRRAGGPACKRPLVANTLRRVARGVERYVIGAAEPFIVPITHSGVRSKTTAEALWTVCGGPKGGEFALVAPAIVRTDMQSAADRNGVHDPRDPMRTATAAGGFANVSAFLVPRYGERDGQDPRCRTVEEPYPSPVPDGNGGGLAAIHLSRQFGCSVGSAADDPVGVVTPGGGGKTSVVAAYLGRQHGSTVSGRDLREPGPAETAGGGHGGGHSHVVAAFMAQGNGDRVGRPLPEPVTTLTERSTQQQLVAASIQSYYATGTGSDAGEPMRVVTKEDRHALIAAWLEQAATGLVGHEAREPVSTIVGKGCTQRLIEARLEQEGGGVGRRADVLAFLWSHFGAPTPEEWADPAGSLRARLRFGLVILGGADDRQVWMIVDIGLRMLKAKELGGAMGLPPDVDFETDVFGRPITTTDQVNMIGNMVCPGMVRAVALANAPDWDIPTTEEAA